MIQRQPMLRFAPSPTGYLHIGGARTAVFNYLYAKKLGGKFLLRIEDTDKQRSKKEYEEDILEALKWLGLSWDESPLRQSLHISFHREAVEELIERGAAFRCFLAPEEAQKIKDDLMRKGGLVAFRSPHRYLSPAESEEKAAAGEPFAVRFKVPDEPLQYKDGVHGMVRVAPESIDDFIIMRRDRTPTYMVAVVVDDFEMGVTHVIRGDDHISNTPKQIMIYKALGWPVPEFVHVPLILGKDKKRLSKRHGATALTEYKKRGFLPETMLCYLALLGWSPGDDREILTRGELLEAFDIQGINKANAVFDEVKLEWMNGEFISRMDDREIADALREKLKEQVEAGIFDQDSESQLPVAASMLKSRCRFLDEILERGYYFFKDPDSLERKAAKKRLKDPAIPNWLTQLAERFEELDDFSAASLENVLREQAESLEISSGKLIHPVRLAVSGQGVGPGLFELLEVLGKEKVVRRIHWLVRFLKERGVPPVLDEPATE